MGEDNNSESLESLTKQKGELKEIFLTGEISSEQYENLRKEIDLKISKIEEEKKQVEKTNEEKIENDGGTEKNKEKEKGVKNNNVKGSDKVGWTIVLISIFLLIGVLYFLFTKMGIHLPSLQIPQAGDNMGLLLLFLAGILTGFHCVSMCGGFVVSYTSKNALRGHKGFKQHLVYGTSKVISYSIIGGLFGLLGGVIAFSVGLRGWIAIFAGVFMIFYAFSMFGIKFFRKFQINPKFLMRITTNASKNAKGYYFAPMVTGLLTGLFIACGPLQAMYLYAMGSGNFFNGFSSLMAFGIGTLPIILGFGGLTTVISHTTTRKILKFSGIIVLILGIIMLNRGLTVLGSPYSYSGIQSKLLGGNSIAGGTSSVLTNGVQEINMNVDAYGYSPNSFVLKKGVLTKWNINVKQLTGCNEEIVSREYGIDTRLKQGAQTIEFTPEKEGTFSFTCGMGMLRGSFIVTETGTATQQEVVAATPASGGSCSMGAGGGGCGCGG